MNTKSPTFKPKKQPIKKGTYKEMTFPEAMKEVIGGKKIHKKEWEDKEYYGFLNGDILSLHKPDGKNYQWIISDGDLYGDDYIILT